MHSHWRKHDLRQPADSSYHVFTEASYFLFIIVWQWGNLFEFHFAATVSSLLFYYYIIIFSALALYRMDTSLQCWNIIQHLQSCCFRLILHGPAIVCDLWFFRCSYLLGFMKYKIRTNPGWTFLRPGSDQVQAKMEARITLLFFSWISSTFPFLSILPSPHLSLMSSTRWPPKGRKLLAWVWGLLGDAGAEAWPLLFWSECLRLRLLSRPRLSLLPPTLARRRSLRTLGGNWVSSSPSSWRRDIS